MIGEDFAEEVIWKPWATRWGQRDILGKECSMWYTESQVLSPFDRE